MPWSGFSSTISLIFWAVTDNIAYWFVNEIEQSYQDLGTYENYVSGPNAICYNDQKNYSITIPAASNITWSVGNGLSIVSGANSNVVTIKSTYTSAAKKSQISVTFTPTCADVTTNSLVKFTKTIWTGNPAFTIHFVRDGADCNYYAKAFPDDYPGATFLWSRDNVHYSSGPNPWTYYGFFPHLGASENVWVKGVTPCGTSSVATAHFSIQNKPAGCQLKSDNDTFAANNFEFPGLEEYNLGNQKIIAFPNPTHSSWKIESSSNRSGSYTLELSNLSGQKVWRKETEYLNNILISGSKLVSGCYILHILDNSSKSSLKIKLLKDWYWLSR